MSFYRFNDTVTLYTCYDDDAYEHHVINSTKVQIVDSDTPENVKVTVYVPLFGRRSLKYLRPSQRSHISKNTFTVKAGQKLVIGKCNDDYPPDDAFDVKRVDTHLSGSHHVQHIKIIAYNEEDE